MVLVLYRFVYFCALAPPPHEIKRLAISDRNKTLENSQHVESLLWQCPDCRILRGIPPFQKQSLPTPCLKWRLQNIPHNEPKQPCNFIDFIFIIFSGATRPLENLDLKIYNLSIIYKPKNKNESLMLDYEQGSSLNSILLYNPVGKTSWIENYTVECPEFSKICASKTEIICSRCETGYTLVFI